MLLSSRLFVESSLFDFNRVCAWTSQTSKVIFLHEMDILFLFGLACLRLHLELLGQVLEVKSASVFIKLALSFYNILDLLHLDRLNLV